MSEKILSARQVCETLLEGETAARPDLLLKLDGDRLVLRHPKETAWIRTYMLDGFRIHTPTPKVVGLEEAIKALAEGPEGTKVCSTGGGMTLRVLPDNWLHVGGSDERVGQLPAIKLLYRWAPVGFIIEYPEDAKPEPDPDWEPDSGLVAGGVDLPSHLVSDTIPVNKAEHEDREARLKELEVATEKLVLSEARLAAIEAAAKRVLRAWEKEILDPLSMQELQEACNI